MDFHYEANNALNSHPHWTIEQVSICSRVSSCGPKRIRDFCLPLAFQFGDSHYYLEGPESTLYILELVTQGRFTRILARHGSGVLNNAATSTCPTYLKS